MKVPQRVTGCEGEMEGERVDQERSEGEVNYKAADSGGASQSLYSHAGSEPREAAPMTGGGRGVITPLNTARGGISG